MQSVTTDGPTTAAPPLGARDLRKRAVGGSIERIAVDLALELGSDGVTVDMICERALISHRTFYNYFPTKEAAIFGSGPQPVPEGLEAFRHGTSRDVMNDLLDLLSASAFPQGEPTELFRDRARLIQKEPQLALKAAPKFDQFFVELTELTLDRLTNMFPAPERLPELRDRAGMTVALATAVMKRAFQTQLEAADDADPRAVLDSSISLARRILTEGHNS